MSKEDKGHFAKKHPPGTEIDPAVEKALRAALKDNRITCTDAHNVAFELDVTPAIIGQAIDLLEACIADCQLGLFGYMPEAKRVKRAETILPELEEALKKRNRDNRIPCIICWEIAADLDIPRQDVADACEALGIRIKPCQLGAF